MNKEDDYNLIYLHQHLITGLMLLKSLFGLLLSDNIGDASAVKDVSPLR